MTQPLRPQQARTIADVFDKLRRGFRAPLIVAPTGMGKTRLAAELLRRTQDKGNVGIFVCGRIELINQTVESLNTNGVQRVAVFRADDERWDPSAKVIVATPQTMTRRQSFPPARVLVLDEARHYAPNGSDWNAVGKAYPNAIRIGLDATPQRADGAPMGDLFDCIVVGASYSELLGAGLLAHCEVISAPKRLASSLAQAPADAYLEHGRGMAGIVFASTVAESAACASTLLASGVRAAHIDGTSLDRQEVIERFKQGGVDVLCSCALLLEGFDAPRAKLAVVARCCSHAASWIQICGRVLRPYQGQSALILDLTGAVWDHGWPTEDRTYSLTGDPIRRSDESEVTVWQCKACFYCMSACPASRCCPLCSSVLPEPESLRIARLKLERQREEEHRARHVAQDADHMARRPDSPAHWLVSAMLDGRGMYKRRYKEHFGCWPTSAVLIAAKQLKEST